jgi:beta-glucanase (GH16 family)
VWSDDFTGAAGSAPDASKWGFLTGGTGFGNQEREYYTSGRNNSFLDGAGDLVIQARKDDAAQHQCWYGACQYTSARLTTQGKFSQARGRAFDHPFFLILNLAIGGSWPGDPNGSTPFLAKMTVDYVRVFTAA